MSKHRARDAPLLGKSLFLFDGNSRVRQTCHGIVEHTTFEYATMLVILASSVAVGFAADDKQQKSVLLDALEYTAQGFFTYVGVVRCLRWRSTVVV